MRLSGRGRPPPHQGTVAAPRQSVPYIIRQDPTLDDKLRTGAPNKTRQGKQLQVRSIAQHHQAKNPVKLSQTLKTRRGPGPSVKQALPTRKDVKHHARRDADHGAHCMCLVPTRLGACAARPFQNPAGDGHPDDARQGAWLVMRGMGLVIEFQFCILGLID